MTDEIVFYLSLSEVTASFGVSDEVICAIVDEGIVMVEGTQAEWRFDNEAVRCIRTVLQLERDLGVNLQGAALALELLAEIDRLKRG